MKRMMFKMAKTPKTYKGKKDRFSDGEPIRHNSKMVFCCDVHGEYEALRPKCDMCEVG